MNPRPGEVWPADLGLAAKTRPVIVVSRYDPNPPRALVICVPVTSQYRESLYEVRIPRTPFLQPESYANVQGLTSLPLTRLERRLGRLTGEFVVQLRETLRYALNFT